VLEGPKSRFLLRPPHKRPTGRIHIHAIAKRILFLRPQISITQQKLRSLLLPWPNRPHRLLRLPQRPNADACAPGRQGDNNDQAGDSDEPSSMMPWVWTQGGDPPRPFSAGAKGLRQNARYFLLVELWQGDQSLDAVDWLWRTSLLPQTLQPTTDQLLCNRVSIPVRLVRGPSLASGTLI